VLESESYFTHGTDKFLSEVIRIYRFVSCVKNRHYTIVVVGLSSSPVSVILLVEPNPIILSPGPLSYQLDDESLFSSAPAGSIQSETTSVSPEGFLALKLEVFTVPHKI